MVRMREMKQINQAKEAQLKQILTPQQFEKYLASKEQMRENLAEKGKKSPRALPRSALRGPRAERGERSSRVFEGGASINS